MGRGTFLTFYLHNIRKRVILAFIYRTCDMYSPSKKHNNMAPIVNITINMSQNDLVVVRGNVLMGHVTSSYEKYSAKTYVEANLKELVSELIDRYGLNLTINIQDGRND